MKKDWYYDWDRMVDDWAKDGVRPMVYMNPYIADISKFNITIRQD